MSIYYVPGTFCDHFIHSFIITFINMYKIPTVCQVLHKLSSESVSKPCKVGIKIPVLQIVQNEAKEH